MNSYAIGHQVRIRVLYRRYFFLSSIYSITIKYNHIYADTSTFNDVKVGTHFKAAASVIAVFKESLPIELNSDDCGVLAKKNFFLTAAGGENTNWQHWPWAAAMYIGKTYECTVNFLSRSVGLTAAHCFYGGTVAAKNVKIKLFNNEGKHHEI